MPSRVRRFMPAFVCLLLIAGCGSSDTVLVTGKLIRSSRPFGPGPSQSLAMTFRPVDTSPKPSAAAGAVYPAQVNPDGTFEVPGPEGRGIPRGKYRVTLLLRKKPNPTKPNLPTRPHGPVEDREKDWLLGQFNDKNSPVVRDVERPEEVLIDLDKFASPPSQAAGLATSKAESEG